MKAFAIKDPKRNILPWYTTFYAGVTKNKFVRMYYEEHAEWKEYYKLGYRCIAVKITEIKK